MAEAEAAAPPPPPPAPPEEARRAKQKGQQHKGQQQGEVAFPLGARAGQATGKRTKKWVVTLQPVAARPARC
eukprot:3271959-Lingulodinium_polyedra.AAC.1